MSLEADKVKNVTPRYAKLRAGANGSAKGQIIGWENIELISDRPLETMLKEFKQLKEEYPDRILIASIMEEYNKAAWEELIYRVEETGILFCFTESIKINFSCPHGMPEHRMGAAVGQYCDLLEEVCRWINDVATVPVWAKMTPNITDITKIFRSGIFSCTLGKRRQRFNYKREAYSPERGEWRREECESKRSERSQVLLARTVNENGTLHIRATKVGSQSAFSQIVGLVESAQMAKAPIQKFADRISKYFVPLASINKLPTKLLFSPYSLGWPGI